jgi:2-oxoisovalerate dehydrogenase E1 component
MPKSQPIIPEKVFEKGYIHFEDIPVCQYNKTLAEEQEIYSKEDLLRIYHDMRTIREFETMLNEVKTKSAYNGIEYNNPGPAHLSIGQEASAVGQAYNLDIDDLTFGSHRSHGEILAKGLSSIHKLSNEEVYAVMKELTKKNLLDLCLVKMRTDYNNSTYNISLAFSDFEVACNKIKIIPLVTITSLYDTLATQYLSDILSARKIGKYAFHIFF